MSPDDAFESVVGEVTGSALEGKSLLAVLRQGGGSKALSRHTVAAYLNAAAASVDFGFASSNDVVTAFQNLYASAGPNGKNGDYTSVKDEFEELNEQGCPLN